MGKRRMRLVESDGPPDTLRAKPVLDELDLHGCQAAEAEIKLVSFLQRWSRHEPGAVVRVITGRGAHSGKGPVLRDLVRGLLSGRLDQFVDEWLADVGAFLVKVR